MKQIILITLATLLMSINIISCKKNNVSPESTTYETEQVYTPNQDTSITPTQTITPYVNTSTITLNVVAKTISAIPASTGAYKIGNMLYKINNLPNVLLTGLSLNCVCNPRSQYIQGLAVGDTVRIWLNLVEAGSESHNGLPSFDTQFNQSNGYTHYGTQYIHKKQSGEIIYVVKPY